MYEWMNATDKYLYMLYSNLCAMDTNQLKSQTVDSAGKWHPSNKKTKTPPLSSCIYRTMTASRQQWQITVPDNFQQYSISRAKKTCTCYHHVVVQHCRAYPYDLWDNREYSGCGCSEKKWTTVEVHPKPLHLGASHGGYYSAGRWIAL